jgi:hypothetical protein
LMEAVSKRNRFPWVMKASKCYQTDCLPQLLTDWLALSLSLAGRYECSFLAPSLSKGGRVISPESIGI